MVAVRNSKKFETLHNCDGSAAIEIWSNPPIRRPGDGAFCNENFFDGIDIVACFSIEEFEEKYGKKLDYGESMEIPAT